MSLTQLSAEITDLLGLALAPVAITFHADSAPEGVRHFDAPMSQPTEDGRSGRVPASCVFWSYGHDETFTTVPEDHGNCSVGRFTHGIAPAEEILDKQDVGTLLEVGWVTMEAFAGVAAKSTAPAAITYSPLGETSSSRGSPNARSSPGLSNRGRSRHRWDAPSPASGSGWATTS